jgi:hypothetical protein
MLYMILTNGAEYRVEPIPGGACPDFIIERKYSGWMFVDDANSINEASSKIRADRDPCGKRFW